MSKMDEEVLLKEVGEFKLYRLKSKRGVIRISNIMRSVRIGQLVTASGRQYRVPKGTVGIVTKIVIPFNDGRTSDVIAVWFEGCDTSYFMKFEDLELEPY
ncbi:MAG: hypothetical protein Q7R89_03575 [bacterium]|nr:hypothetical protein [bacterium]